MQQAARQPVGRAELRDVAAHAVLAFTIWASLRGDVSARKESLLFTTNIYTINALKSLIVKKPLSLCQSALPIGAEFPSPKEDPMTLDSVKHGLGNATLVYLLPHHDQLYWQSIQRYKAR